MLLEFVLTNGVASKNTPPRPLFLLMNQIVAVHEPPSYMAEATGGDPIRRCMVTIRGGNEFEVADPVDDVLDAMKFASRHIGVTPGIADKLDGENGEEIYPWRRTEKVSELARKWRERMKAEANKGKAPPPLNIRPGVTKEGVRVDPDFIPPPPVWPPQSPPLSPTESSGEAPSAGSATPEPTSESSPPPPCPPKG